MICAKCRRSFQDDAVFCPYCGKKQAVLPKKGRTKSRGNGTGTAFKRGYRVGGQAFDMFDGKSKLSMQHVS